MSTEQNVELDQELNPIILPTRMYEFFMANGREGFEGMQLWLHLVYTARRQQTNQVWVQDTYLQQGLAWGERKIRTIRSWLHKHGLIEYVEPARDPKGRFTSTNGHTESKRYIRVKASSQFLQSSETAFTARAENGACGNDGQMLEGTIEMLKRATKGGVGVLESSWGLDIDHTPADPDTPAPTPEPSPSPLPESLTKEEIQAIASEHGIDDCGADTQAVASIAKLVDAHGYDRTRAALVAFMRTEGERGKAGKAYYFASQFDQWDRVATREAEQATAAAERRAWWNDLTDQEPTSRPTHSRESEERAVVLAEVARRPEHPEDTIDEIGYEHNLSTSEIDHMLADAIEKWRATWPTAHVERIEAKKRADKLAQFSTMKQAVGVA